ncbi:MAG: hypothetical protein QOE35_2177 [Actinomycetota bacterium]|jgi:hypothetical protein
MCETLPELRSATVALAADFDAHVLSVTSARRALRGACAIKNAVTTIESLAAARVAEGGDWRRDGYRSPAEAVAAETGTSVGQAAEAMRTAEALDELPGVSAAATCAAAGCSQSARLQRDHRDDWAKTHFTLFDLLDLLCAHHHRLKTTKGWGLVEGRGKRAFVPPDDPRHPRHAKDPPAA